MPTIGGAIASSFQSGFSLRPQTATSTANGSSVDMQDTGELVTCVLSVGTVSGTSPTLDVKLQDSPDDSTFTDISGATMTQVTASNKFEVKTFGGRVNRYVRAVATIAGTSPSFVLAVNLHAKKSSY